MGGLSRQKKEGKEKTTPLRVAAHEQRMNFPLTLARMDDAKKLEEMMFPGVHSDVGGGYAPGNQGRSLKTVSNLLSQIPLLHMYKARLVRKRRCSGRHGYLSKTTLSCQQADRFQ